MWLGIQTLSKSCEAGWPQGAPGGTGCDSYLLPVEYLKVEVFMISFL